MLYGFQTPGMGDINPQIDLVYVCFLQGRVYKPLKNRNFHEVSAGIPCVSWGKSRYGKVRSLSRRIFSLDKPAGFRCKHDLTFNLIANRLEPPWSRPDALGWN